MTKMKIKTANLKSLPVTRPRVTRALNQTTARALKMNKRALKRNKTRALRTNRMRKSSQQSRLLGPKI